MQENNPQTQQAGNAQAQQQKQGLQHAFHVFPQHSLWQQKMPTPKNVNETKGANSTVSMGNYVLQPQGLQQAQQEAHTHPLETSSSPNENLTPPSKNEEGSASASFLLEPSHTLETSPKQTLEEIRKLIVQIEKNLEKVKSLLSHFASEKTQETEQKDTDEEVEVIEGIFDGVNMVGFNKKKYPVPANYASKSKLIPGDKLKLKILASGQMVYKVIELAERQICKGTLSKDEKTDKFIALRNGKAFFLNHAAVTYFKGKVGDDVYIIINKQTQAPYAAVEAIVKQ